MLLLQRDLLIGRTGVSPTCIMTVGGKKWDMFLGAIPGPITWAEGVHEPGHFPDPCTKGFLIGASEEPSPVQWRRMQGISGAAERGEMSRWYVTDERGGGGGGLEQGWLRVAGRLCAVLSRSWRGASLPPAFSRDPFTLVLKTKPCQGPRGETKKGKGRVTQTADEDERRRGRNKRNVSHDREEPGAVESERKLLKHWPTPTQFTHDPTGATAPTVKKKKRRRRRK